MSLVVHVLNRKYFEIFFYFAIHVTTSSFHSSGERKGGSGKSTTAMHVAIGLLRLGYRVGTIDLDARQGTFTRYMANRFEYIGRHKLPLPSLFISRLKIQSRHRRRARTGRSRFLYDGHRRIAPCYRFYRH